MFYKKRCEPNRWKGFVAGILGSLAGLFAMRYYWQAVAPKVSNPDRQPLIPESHPLDDISQVGQQYQEDESSTAALGRIIYQQIVGKPPETEETKTLLSYLVHWGYGLFQGGVYGAARTSASGLDVEGGLLYGAGLWFVGDELAVPMLGLQPGPTEASAPQHINRLGAHLFYGVITAAVTQILRRIL